eukprot:ctg_631.g337
MEADQPAEPRRRRRALVGLPKGIDYTQEVPTSTRDPLAAAAAAAAARRASLERQKPSRRGFSLALPTASEPIASVHEAAAAVSSCTHSDNSRLVLPPEPFCVLGIETSCDDTAAAVVRSDGTILAEHVVRQDEIHAAHGGVVPGLARDAHRAAIDRVIEWVLRRAFHVGESDDPMAVAAPHLAAVATTMGPGLEICLRVGFHAARQTVERLRALQPASSSRLPLFLSMHHLEAHCLVARRIPPHELHFRFWCCWRAAVIVCCWWRVISARPPARPRVGRRWRPGAGAAGARGQSTRVQLLGAAAATTRLQLFLRRAEDGGALGDRKVPPPRRRHRRSAAAGAVEPAGGCGHRRQFPVRGGEASGGAAIAGAAMVSGARTQCAQRGGGGRRRSQRHRARAVASGGAPGGMDTKMPAAGRQHARRGERAVSAATTVHRQWCHGGLGRRRARATLWRYRRRARYGGHRGGRAVAHGCSRRHERRERGGAEEIGRWREMQASIRETYGALLETEGTSRLQPVRAACKGTAARPLDSAAFRAPIDSPALSIAPSPRVRLFANVRERHVSGASRRPAVPDGRRTRARWLHGIATAEERGCGLRKRRLQRKV